MSKVRIQDNLRPGNKQSQRNNHYQLTFLCPISKQLFTMTRRNVITPLV